MRRSTSLFLGLAFALGLFLPAELGAAGLDSSSSTSREPSKVEQAQSKINAGDYAGAVPLLEEAVSANANDADAFNLLGYSHRKMGELDKAYDYYGKALAIEPEHRGANEYLGELYLEKGDIAKAEERLKVLDDACFFGCEEHRELKEAIESYKAKTGAS